MLWLVDEVRADLWEAVARAAEHYWTTLDERPVRPSADVQVLREQIARVDFL